MSETKDSEYLCPQCQSTTRVVRLSKLSSLMEGILLEDFVKCRNENCRAMVAFVKREGNYDIPILKRTYRIIPSVLGKK